MKQKIKLLITHQNIVPFLALLVFLGIVLLFIFSYFNGLENYIQNKAVSTTKLPTYTIRYTTEGYVPKILEIPLGALVLFVNSSTIPMWTASDPHPTHSDFPSFDAHKDYSDGETQTFTFTKSGTFGYHNHNKSLHRGVVKVTDLANPLPEISKTKASQEATRQKLLALFVEDDPDSIFKLLDNIQASPNLANDCHDIAHDLGHKAYELYGFSAAMTFANPNRLGHPQVDDVCAGGYMHGIVEELFLNQPELKETPERICAGIPVANRDSCFHGIGHSFMFVNKRGTSASLADCRQISDTIYTRRCFEGVWMELFWGNTDHAGAGSLGWTPEQPLEPCRQAQDDEKPTCFLYAHLGYLRNNPRNYEGAVKLCTQNDLDLYDVRYCLRGVGLTMMKHVTSKHLEQTEDLVKDLGNSDKYAYYEGVIGYSRLSNVSESRLKSFCNNLVNDSKICTSVLTNTN